MSLGRVHACGEAITLNIDKACWVDGDAARCDGDHLPELAEQGLERLAEQTTAPIPEQAQGSLISDPFLAASSQSSQSSEAAIPQPQTTATPWLDLTPEPVTQPDETVVAVETAAEDPIPDASANVPETNSSPPVPEGLLQKLEAGRLRVTL